MTGYVILLALAIAGGAGFAAGSKWGSTKEVATTVRSAEGMVHSCRSELAAARLDWERENAGRIAHLNRRYMEALDAQKSAEAKARAASRSARARAATAAARGAAVLREFDPGPGGADCALSDRARELLDAASAGRAPGELPGAGASTTSARDP